MAKIKVYFVRHGLTNRNIRGVFCGRTNALVSEEGRAELHKLRENYDYPEVERVFCSPAIRCRETASILYPNHEPEILEGFWEQNFGEIEDKSLSDWNDIENMEKWLNQDLSCMFPGGESILEAKLRSIAAMTHLIQRCIEDDLREVALVAHGQIMGVLLKACLVTDEPEEAFLLCPNGMGYIGEVDTEEWFKEQKIIFAGFLPEGADRPKAEDTPYFKRRVRVKEELRKRRESMTI